MFPYIILVSSVFFQDCQKVIFGLDPLFDSEADSQRYHRPAMVVPIKIHNVSPPRPYSITGVRTYLITISQPYQLRSIHPSRALPRLFIQLTISR